MYVWMMVLLMACGTQAPDSSPAPVAQAGEQVPAEISIDAFKAKHAQGATVIDVRTPAEWQAGHVPGATHVPLADVQGSHPEIKKLSTDTEIYFICASGGRSGKATERMRAAGYQAVNVLGGTNAWIASGNPVEKD